MPYAEYTLCTDLDLNLYLGEQINKFYIRRQEKSPRGRRTKVELGMQEIELHDGRGPRVASD